MTHISYYQGCGTQRPADAPALPEINIGKLTDPSGYRASRELAAAVDVALSLGMPLLLTGEPGLGKSQLARSIAWELGLGEVLDFTAKSDTRGSDLFYTFDTVGRFHAAQTDDVDSDPRRFINLNALGKAILRALPKDCLKNPLGPIADGLHLDDGGSRSVVLIDEIDKAPRDVPNDILTEIEQMAFKIPEIARQGEASPEFRLAAEQNRYRPIVIITSNSEKGLPDPFLRRCVYHHIEFPAYEHNGDERQVTISDVVAARLGERYEQSESRFVNDVIKLFCHLRAQEAGYRPSLAELLNLLDYLLPTRIKRFIDIDEESRYTAIQRLLFKNQLSQQKSKALLDGWFKE